MKMTIEKYALDEKKEESKAKRKILGTIKIQMPTKETEKEEAQSAEELQVQIQKPQIPHKPKKKKSTTFLSG